MRDKKFEEAKNKVFSSRFFTDLKPRDPNRIPVVMDKLMTMWKKYPDMRLGQLLVNVLPYGITHRELFNLEDDKLLDALERFDL